MCCLSAVASTPENASPAAANRLAMPSSRSRLGASGAAGHVRSAATRVAAISQIALLQRSSAADTCWHASSSPAAIMLNAYASRSMLPLRWWPLPGDLRELRAPALDVALAVSSREPAAGG